MLTGPVLRLGAPVIPARGCGAHLFVGGWLCDYFDGTGVANHESDHWLALLLKVAPSTAIERHCDRHVAAQRSQNVLLGAIITTPSRLSTSAGSTSRAAVQERNQWKQRPVKPNRDRGPKKTRKS